jgi:hypothetical protein
MEASMFRRAFSGCLGAICAVFAVIVGCGVLAHLNTAGSSSNTPDETKQSVPQIAQRSEAIDPPKPTEMITVPAIQLDADYSANEVAADQKYAGKIIRVYGAVGSIDKGPLGNVHIVFMNDPIFGGSSLGIDAMMEPGSDDVAARLMKWQRTVVICDKAERSFGIVSLSGCKFDLSNSQPKDNDTQAPPLESSY